MKRSWDEFHPFGFIFDVHRLEIKAVNKDKQNKINLSASEAKSTKAESWE